jgi:hypothetical protein
MVWLAGSIQSAGNEIKCNEYSSGPEMEQRVWNSVEGMKLFVGMEQCD